MNNKLAAKAEFVITDVLNQLWVEGASYSYENKTRPEWGFCYVESGEVLYRERGRKITAEKGNVVVLKKDAQYRAEFLRETRCILVNFRCDTDFTETKDGVTAIETGEEMKNFFADILDYSLFEEKGCMIKSIFYGILDGICARNSETNLSVKIKRTVNSDTGFVLKEADIAKKCAVSISTAQRAFKQAYGKTVWEYRCELRMTRAKTLLRSGAYSVEEVAELLNFCDCAHFSRSFKKSEKITPRKYVKRESNII